MNSTTVVYLYADGRSTEPSFRYARRNFWLPSNRTANLPGAYRLHPKMVHAMNQFGVIWSTLQVYRTKPIANVTGYLCISTAVITCQSTSTSEAADRPGGTDSNTQIPVSLWRGKVRETTCTERVLSDQVAWMWNRFPLMAVLSLMSNGLWGIIHESYHSTRSLSQRFLKAQWYPDPV